MQIQASLTDIWLTLPGIILFVTSLIPITLKVLNGNREPNSFAILIQGLIGVIAATVVAVVQWDNQTGYAFNQSLVFDGLSSGANILTLFITGISLVLAHDNIATKSHQFAEQVCLILNSALGMMLVVWSNDLIVTFIGIELMSLSLYILIGLSLEEKLAKEASFKYFILGSFGSAFLLYGIALIYGSAETTFLSRLTEAAPALMASNKIFLIGMILLIVGIGFKIAMFPFQAWAPDVYQGAPTPITAFMATGVKVAAFVLLIRTLLTKALSGSENLLSALEWTTILTVLVGNLAAIRQENFKRLLAYSSIAHSGYILIGVMAAATSQDPSEALTAVLFYLVTYSFMNLGIFALVSLYEKTEHHSMTLEDLKGLSSRRPGLALCLTLLLVSLAGIPPTAGFFGKLYLFEAAVSQGLYWLAVWGVVGSVISVYYYLKPVVHMYMYEPATIQEDPSRQMGTSLTLVAMSILVVLVGVASNPLWSRLHITIHSLWN